ncbi:hypothetical protein GCM10010420_26760 [Streptomyces glaucosporus]|uniref:DUF485 domain-containing protein n=1 Tax=Streptomyces glaucosporus TaxID=284044 RepID=A0ABP5VFC4_9ACTN
MRIDDPWYDAFASGRDGRPEDPAGTVPERPGAGPEDRTGARAAPSGRTARRRRRFALPAAVAFLVWCPAYAVTATAAPDLMGRPLGGGPLTVGFLAGLAQFSAVSLLARAYVRHTRPRRRVGDPSGESGGGRSGAVR